MARSLDNERIRRGLRDVVGIDADQVGSRRGRIRSSPEDVFRTSPTDIVDVELSEVGCQARTLIRIIDMLARRIDEMQVEVSGYVPRERELQIARSDARPIDALLVRVARRSAHAAIHGIGIEVLTNAVTQRIGRQAIANERTGGIDACRRGHAIVHARDAFVDIRAHHAIAQISHVAIAIKGARRIRTRRVHVAVIEAIGAFVDIGAETAITNIPAGARTSERSGRVCTCRIRITIVRV